MEAIAKTKHLKGSPRKARLVIDMIRGVNVSRALAILKFTDKRAADPIAKTLLSAIANATFKAEKQNIAIDPDDLFVKSCFVDMGAHKNRRRMRPAPQGRAYREQRHYCHITIEVSSEKPDEGKVRNAKITGEEETKKSASKRAATKQTDAGERTAKASAKKADEVKAAQATAEEGRVEEVETATTATATEQTVEETTTTATANEQTAEETSPKATESSKAVAEEETEGDADASDAKDTATQFPEELNETKRADDKQEDVNEQLERQ
ncbi:MAG TPA: 50S ribosomal protein L22 [Pyrinomonadaceae bacterium]|jgi:large subunit ribosomal protein L22